MQTAARFFEGGFPRSRNIRRQILAVSILAGLAAGAAGDETPMILVGTNAVGATHNAPADWPSSAGAWNGKGDRSSASKGQLVFETYREDIRGGSKSGGITAPGVKGYYVAGPNTGADAVSGTTVLYVAKSDGSQPRCVGGTDVQDGVAGAEIVSRGAKPGRRGQDARPPTRRDCLCQPEQGPCRVAPQWPLDFCRRGDEAARPEARFGKQ